jgi:tetratricopeptide (TPR) repeat protein
VGEYISSKPVRELSFVGDAVAAELFAFLKGRLKKRDVLLVLDDAHAFDDATVRTLANILSNLTVLSERNSMLSILATLNEDEYTDPLLELERLLATFNQVQLNRCTLDQFPDVLKALHIDLGDAPPEFVRDFFYRSAGHLRVLAEIARHLQHEEATSAAVVAEGDLLEIALRTRLSEKDLANRDLRSLLMRLAIVGVTFTRNEAQCILQEQQSPDLGWILDRALQMQLIQRDGGFLYFQHPSIRDFFLRASASQRRKWHKVFAGCLRLLRPSDYSARAHHLGEAEDQYGADCLRILSWTRSNRAGRDPLPPAVTTANYSDFIAQVRLAHLHMRRGQYDEARSALAVIHDSYPLELLAERDFTVAECLLEGITHDAFSKALRVLEPWAGSVDHEPELNFRLVYLLAMAHVLAGDYELAARQFSELQRSVAAIRTTDPGIQRMLNRVQLVSDCLHKIEVSGGRIYSALRTLLQAEESGAAFNPIDLYVALTNYAGNRLIAGEYDDASRFADRALLLRHDYEEAGLPSGEAALNNHLLADFLGGRVTADETLGAFRRLMEIIDQPADHILLCVNYANLAMLAEKTQEALDVLDRVRPLPVDSLHDEYYVYYANHAYAAALLLSGQRSSAERLWLSLDHLLERQPPGVREFLSLRHQLLSGAVRDPMVTSPQDWDSYLWRVPEQRGRPWRFFKRGFLFTDIQIWFHL